MRVLQIDLAGFSPVPRSAGSGFRARNAQASRQSGVVSALRVTGPESCKRPAPVSQDVGAVRFDRQRPLAPMPVEEDVSQPSFGCRVRWRLSVGVRGL